MTVAALLAGALAGPAVALLLVDRSAPLRRVGRLDGAGPPQRAAGRAAVVARWRLPVLLAAVVLLLGRSLLLAAATTVAVRTVLRVVADRQRRREVDAGAEASAELLSALAAELRGGARPAEALAAAAVAGPAWAAALARPGPDPPALLEALGRRPGGLALADLATAWRVVETTGAALADVAARAAETARAELATRRTVAAELAAARATSTLLAGLPVAGVLLGTGLGADPLGFLLGTTAGRACVLAGVLLMAAGTVWTGSVARRAEQP